MVQSIRTLLDRSFYPSVFSILGLAAAYYGAARLSLLITPSPGYSPWISLAAGIAFCAVLLFGYRIWPGVLIGSFLFNVWPPHGDSGTTLFISLALAASIGIGATLQALAGAFLVHRFIGFPNPLDRGLDALALLILAGPAACLIGAIWGVASLAAAGVATPTTLPLECMTWWAGDTFGILTLTPLAIVWLGEPRALWERRCVQVSLPLCIVFALIITFLIYANGQEDRRIRRDFEQRTENITSVLGTTLDDYLDVLHALESLYASSERIMRTQFAVFVWRLLTRFPAIQALSWNPILTDAERASYEQAAQQEGYAGFEFRQRDRAGKLVRAETQPEYVVTYFVEPYEGNKNSLGFDRASDPITNEALLRARDRGRAIATRPLTLVQESGKEVSFIVFMPIYRRGLPRDSVEMRRRNILGYLAGAFRLPDLMAASVATIQEKGVQFKLFDESQSSSVYTYRTGVAAKERAVAPVLTNTTGLEVAGRQWRLEFQPTAEFVASRYSWQGWSIIVGGMLFSGVSGAFLLVVSGHTARVERLVEERTVELAKANKERGDFTAMIIHDLRSPLNVITGVSQVMEEGLLGPLNEEQRDWFARLKDNAQHMLHIVTDYLDVSKLEAGRVELAKTQIDLSRLTNACFTNVLALAERKNISLKNVCADGLPKINADARWLGQVLDNLLTNAIKATQAGGEITVGCEQANDNITAWVKDTGVGISPEELPGLFEKYHQTGGRKTSGEKGTGLGLAICKMIVEAHGGRIWAHSAKGEGTTFYFTLPLAG